MSNLDDLIREFDGKPTLTLYGNISSEFNDIIEVTIFKGWQNLTDQYQLMFVSLGVILFAVYGYSYLSGQKNIDWLEFARKVIGFSVVWSLITYYAYFSEWIVLPVTDGVVGLSNAVVQSGFQGFYGTATFENVNDVLLHKGIVMAQILIADDGYASTEGLMAGAIVLTTFWFTARNFGTMLLSKLVVAVLLIVSPIFLPLYFFDATRGAFEGWLRQLLSYAIIPLLLFTVMLLGVHLLALGIEDFREALVTGQRDTGDLHIDFWDAMEFLGAVNVLHLITKRIEPLSCQLFGGVALGAPGGMPGRRSIEKMRQGSEALRRRLSMREST